MRGDGCVGGDDCVDVGCNGGGGDCGAWGRVSLGVIVVDGVSALDVVVDVDVVVAFVVDLVVDLVVCLVVFLVVFLAIGLVLDCLSLLWIRWFTLRASSSAFLFCSTRATAWRSPLVSLSDGLSREFDPFCSPIGSFRGDWLSV